MIPTDLQIPTSICRHALNINLLQLVEVEETVDGIWNTNF